MDSFKAKKKIMALNIPSMQQSWKNERETGLSSFFSLLLHQFHFEEPLLCFFAE